MMTKRHFEAIAESVKESRESWDFLDEGTIKDFIAAAHDRMGHKLAEVFEADNANFDRERFLLAAGEYEATKRKRELS